uniref:DUF1134 domain-containing protein n=1 Tax=Desulfobacca acetoxidans TaxID=60893 RepID=A0A7V4G7J1_9BACT
MVWNFKTASLLLAFTLLLVTPGLAQLDKAPLYPMGEISLEAASAAAGVGFSWGEGTLKFQGKEYKFRVKGLSVAAVGFSRISATGEVYNLDTPTDLAGNYVAVTAGLALARGVEGLVMRNNRGTVIVLRAQQQGVKLSLSVDGFAIEM